MAIPIIVGGIAIAVGTAGLAKGTKAMIDNSDAKNLNNSAKAIVAEAETKLSIAQQDAQKSLEELGIVKANTLETSVKKFLEVFGQIKNVNFEHDGDLGNLALTEFDVGNFSMLKQEVSFVVSSGLGLVGGATSGALAAFGAYNGVMALGAASTGTAISSLSGVAATNATLAWLGGGSLAVGGYGIAGGTMVLGAVAAGPALLLAGWYMGSKAEKNLEGAKSNIAQARSFQADVESALTVVQNISVLAKQLKNLFIHVRDEADKLIHALELIITTQGSDYGQYHEAAKLCVLKNVKIMQLIKVMLDIAILDKDGNILNDVDSNIFKVKTVIENGYKGEID